MDLSKFTVKSQATLTEAQNIAARNQHQAVDVEHLRLALLSQEDGLIPRRFERARAAPALLQIIVEEELNCIARSPTTACSRSSSAATAGDRKFFFRPRSS
jgi:ATP-dependent Clp protease ATP-binding subunit ClpB